MTKGITRRGFLEGAGSVLVLSLFQLNCSDDRDASPGSELGASAPIEYTGAGDLYRQKWQWDSVAKGTHHGNCWYQRCCNFNIYVKDGVVWREEQAGTYPQTNPDVPDFNPRGCQKGGCFSRRMIDPSRVLFPLERVGERGAGRWKRVSWDDAFRRITDKCVDVLDTDGPGAIVWDEGSGGSNIGAQRMHAILDNHVLDLDSEFGDHHPGAAVTCGKISFSSSADDLFYSDLIFIWGGNPTYTQIPNAHFTNEARYHGAQVVAISPDLNASAIHADRWIPVKIASDAALGLSMAQVMIEEEIFDKSFVAEQTDLALLVRTDTRRFLREGDLENGGEEDVFYFFDQNEKKLTLAAKGSLALEGRSPALEGSRTVQTTDGEVTVVPVFELLRKQLAAYTPEAAEAITGVSPNTTRSLARSLAKAKSATCITQSNFGKFYHGLEMERAQFLAFALAGQFGKKGSGINGFPNLWLSGHEGLIAGPGTVSPKLSLLAVGYPAIPDVIKMKWKEYTPEMVMYELMRKRHSSGGQPSSTIFLYRHSGLDEFFGASKQWDPNLKRELGEYLKESIEKGWQVDATDEPRVFFEVGGNYLRRNRGYQKILEELWPKLELVVTVDWRMSFTAMHSDIVLPAAGYYEEDSIPWTTPIAPFAHATTSAVKPLGEAKTDWEFHCLFTKELEARASERGVHEYTDRSGETRKFDGLYDRFTFEKRFTEDKSEALLEEALSLSNNLGDIRWKELKEKGFARYQGLGSGYMNLGNATDIEAEETVTANSWHTEKKRPWPTLTRRMQFYIDHELYFELGEELPVHKDNPKIGGDYPLQLSTGHTRWSVHAAWRDDTDLLRLQRGAPVATLSVEDARARAIEDGDEIRLYNDTSAFQVQAKISPMVRPGQVVFYHAWEPFQFKEHKSQSVLTPNPINPIQLAGGYFHLQPRLAVGTPGPSDRATRIEAERI